MLKVTRLGKVLPELLYDAVVLEGVEGILANEP